MQKKEYGRAKFADFIVDEPNIFSNIIKEWFCSQYYTIMAIGDTLDDGKGRILYFSSPLDLGRGRGVFGDSQNDNRRKHIENR